MKIKYFWLYATLRGLKFLFTMALFPIWFPLGLLFLLSIEVFFIGEEFYWKLRCDWESEQSKDIP